MIFAGQLAADEEQKQAIMRLVETHKDLDFVIMGPPNPYTYKKGRYRVMEAIVTAPSWIMPDNTPIPVCFTHIKGVPPASFSANSHRPSLIPGKAYRTPPREQA